MAQENEDVPMDGKWPADPQKGIEISKDRIWIDGCFDFSHHGHAGAMLQARRLGKYLVVGVHSDEAILENKGPTVMTLSERIAAVDACRWSCCSIPYAPYVTSLPWISHYGCQYVVHGDDITSDSSGEDCYRFVKAAGRFLVVKRTPSISTTDLVGRMLLCTKGHFIQSLAALLEGREGSGTEEEKKQLGAEMNQRIRDYSTDETGHNIGAEVWSWDGPETLKRDFHSYETGHFRRMVTGITPLPGQRVIYVDGGFDLFSSGHIEFLRQVTLKEQELALKSGWFDKAAQEARISKSGRDYGPVYVVAGVHDDSVINSWKGLNYPIMNIYERGLCVLQCVFIHAVIFSAPFTPTREYLQEMPYGVPSVVYHGPTAFIPLDYDPYTDAKAMGIFEQIGNHNFQDVNAAQIVDRILKSRAMYEERQRLKGVKAAGEEEQRQKELEHHKAST